MKTPKSVCVIKHHIRNNHSSAEALARLAMRIRKLIPKQQILFILLAVFLFSSCSGCSSSSSNSSDSNKSGSDYQPSSLYNSSVYYDTDDEEYDEEYDDEYEEGDSKIEDGTHTADVEYYNPNTGYSNSYTLEVEVVDGYVVTIYFPNGGWLDDSHMDPPELDEDGNCTVYTDRGYEYEIHIDN